jgi:hypothetical protein
VQEPPQAFLDKPCGVKGLLQAVSLLLFGRFEAPIDFASSNRVCFQATRPRDVSARATTAESPPGSIRK